MRIWQISETLDKNFIQSLFTDLKTKALRNKFLVYLIIPFLLMEKGIKNSQHLRRKNDIDRQNHW